MVILDNVKILQRIVDRIKNDITLYDNGKTVGLFREVIFGDPNNNNKLAIKQKPAIYITTGKSIQNTKYSLGYSNVNNQKQITVEYDLVILASSKENTEKSQKQLYELVKNLRTFVDNDPTFKIPTNQLDPGTDPVFTRSVINGINPDPTSRGKLITSITITLLATIGASYIADFPDIGIVNLLSKPNAPEGIITSEDKTQGFPNRVLTENGDFGALYVEYESTVELDDLFRAKFGIEEDVTITTASGDKIYHVKYIDINPTAQFDSIERTILHMEIVP